MGLAHSDLSYNNILVDPVTKSACIIDIDGLVVPKLFQPEVIGTADFIAPEVLKTKHLSLKDPQTFTQPKNRSPCPCRSDLYVSAEKTSFAWR
jgi:serine/threonine protein kinase